MEFIVDLLFNEIGDYNDIYRNRNILILLGVDEHDRILQCICEVGFEMA